jgi:hypothetical protein
MTTGTPQRDSIRASLPGAGQRRRRQPEASPARILEAARFDPTDRVLACSARCIQCAGSAEAVRACPRRVCALFVLRPYQVDVPPRGAPHVELGPLETDEDLACFGPPAETEDQRP